MFWKISSNQFTKIGSKVTTVCNRGYIRVRLDGSLYYGHRLVWLYHTGDYPIGVIDHIDGDKLNNAITNLRDTTQSVNSKNTKLYCNNTSGHVGVSLLKNGKWAAYIYVEFSRIHLGVFKNKEEAIKARKEAEVKYGFHENHGRLK